MPKKPHEERQGERQAAILALVRGKVQGVGFRYEARSFAKALGLRGWVMNLDDGGVESWAEGPESAVERYKAWLGKGPPGAQVSYTEFSERQPTGSYAAFTIEF